VEIYDESGVAVGEIREPHPIECERVVAGKYLTKEQFIAQYETNGQKNDEGVVIHGRVKFALPCRCECADCEGWAMVSAEGVYDHLTLSGPMEIREALNG